MRMTKVYSIAVLDKANCIHHSIHRGISLLEILSLLDYISSKVYEFRAYIWLKKAMTSIINNIETYNVWEIQSWVVGACSPRTSYEKKKIGTRIVGSSLGHKKKLQDAVICWLQRHSILSQEQKNPTTKPVISQMATMAIIQVLDMPNAT